MANLKTEVFRFMSIRPPKPKKINKESLLLIKDKTGNNYAKLISEEVYDVKNQETINQNIKDKINEFKAKTKPVVFLNPNKETLFDVDPSEVEYNLYKRVKGLVKHFFLYKKELTLTEFIQDTDKGSLGHKHWLSELAYVNSAEYDRDTLLSKLLNTLYFEKVNKGDKELIEYLTDAIVCLEIYYKGLNDFSNSGFRSVSYKKLQKKTLSEISSKIIIETPSKAFPVYKKITTGGSTSNPAEELRKKNKKLLKEIEGVAARLKDIEERKSIKLKFKSVYDELKRLALQEQFVSINTISDAKLPEELLIRQEKLENQRKELFEKSKKYLEIEKKFFEEEKGFSELDKKKISFEEELSKLEEAKALKLSKKNDVSSKISRLRQDQNSIINSLNSLEAELIDINKDLKTFRESDILKSNERNQIQLAINEKRGDISLKVEELAREQDRASAIRRNIASIDSKIQDVESKKGQITSEKEELLRLISSLEADLGNNTSSNKGETSKAANTITTDLETRIAICQDSLRSKDSEISRTDISLNSLIERKRGYSNSDEETKNKITLLRGENSRLAQEEVLLQKDFSRLGKELFEIKELISYHEERKYSSSRRKISLQQEKEQKEQKCSELSIEEEELLRILADSQLEIDKVNASLLEIEGEKSGFTGRYSEFEQEEIALNNDYRIFQDAKVLLEREIEALGLAKPQILTDNQVKDKIKLLPRVLTDDEFNEFIVDIDKGIDEQAIILSTGVNRNYLEIPFIKSKLEEEIKRLTFLVTRKAQKQQLFIGNSVIDVTPKFSIQEEPIAKERAKAANTHQYSHNHHVQNLLIEPKIEPIGVGDLLVVKQELKTYKEGDIAHVENILASEHKNRSHRRTQRTEEEYSYETELMTEDEKDTQSTERFELQKETSNILNSEKYDDTSVKASASFGGLGYSASISAGKDWGSNSSVQEANTQSSAYAKELTERALERVVSTVKEKRSKKTIAEIEEVNTHGFDNAGSNENITGVYYWLDKYYKAQTYNYGKRLMYKLHVPSPAKRYLEQKKKEAKENNSLLTTPKIPTLNEIDENIEENKLRIDQITRDNYLELCARYGVKDFNIYPDKRKAIYKNFTSKDIGNNQKGIVDTFLIEIPEGYTAQGWFYSTNHTDENTNESKCDIKVIIGDCEVDHYVIPNYLEHVANSGSVIDYDVFFSERPIYKDLAGSIMVNKGNVAYSISVCVLCEITKRTYINWQTKIYKAIMEAYRNQKAEYEEKRRELEAGVHIEGTNPTDNRRLEMEELKRSCIEMMPGFSFEDLGQAITANDDASTTINPEVAKENGKIISFFENAFEWDQMMYDFAPYFWTEKSEWYDVQQIKDKDILFQNFLQASGAEVTLAVKKGYERAVMHYLCTDEIWDGKSPITLGSVHGKPLEDLLDELDTAPEQREGEPVGDPWEIKLPTDLVMLAQDSTLPDYSSEIDDEIIS